MEGRPGEASFENPGTSQCYFRTLLPAMLPGAGHTAGPDMHLPVPGKGTSQAVLPTRRLRPGSLPGQQLQSQRRAPEAPRDPRGPPAGPAATLSGRRCGPGTGPRERPERDRRPRSRWPGQRGAFPGMTPLRGLRRACRGQRHMQGGRF